MGGLFNHFPLRTLGMDGIKKNMAHKDVITRTLGMTPRLVTLQRFCQLHVLTLFSNFYLASQCRATNQKECLSGAHKMTNKAICLFTGCPPLTQSADTEQMLVL